MSFLINTNLDLFTGREYDTESGLYHYRARAYHPELGRFCQKDPIGYVDGLNLYEYVKGRPTFFFDPTGTETQIGGTCRPVARTPLEAITGPRSSFFLPTIGSQGDPARRPRPDESFSPEDTANWDNLSGGLFADPNITGPISGLDHFLFGRGASTSLSPGLISNLRSTSEVVNLRRQLILLVRASLPLGCNRPYKTQDTGILTRSDLLTNPFPPGGFDRNYSFRLNNAIGSIQQVKYRARWNVGSTKSSYDASVGLCCCVAKATNIQFHFDIEDSYNFSGANNALLHPLNWAGTPFRIHNSWDEGYANIEEKRCGKCD